MGQSDFIPQGFHSVTAMLAINNAAVAIEWYKKIFAAVEIYKLLDDDGNIVHAEIKIGDTILMIAEEHPEYNKSPNSLAGTSVIFNVYVPEADNVFNDAVLAGATVIFPVSDQFYGDRAGRIQDPYGHMWIISTHIKDVSPAEMQQQITGNAN
jgi:PhnB protein